jgi:hypothetical protein
MNGCAKLAAAVMVGMLLAPGCGHTRSQLTTQEAQDKPPQAAVHVETGTREVAAQQTLILSARTENTAGHIATAIWKTSGGTLQKEELGDVVRVTFNSPGTYRVTARLKVEGEPTHQDTVEIHVH